MNYAMLLARKRKPRPLATPESVVITAQPASQVAVAGSATFSVSATGENLSYQWQQSADSGSTWSSVPGAVSNTLVVTDITTADNGKQFRAIVSSLTSSAVTSAATLTYLGELVHDGATFDIFATLLLWQDSPYALNVAVNNATKLSAGETTGNEYAAIADVTMYQNGSSVFGQSVANGQSFRVTREGVGWTSGVPTNPTSLPSGDYYFSAVMSYRADPGDEWISGGNAIISNTLTIS